MMYPFLTLDDQTEIVHSQLLDDGSVKVYVEKPDAKDDFDSACGAAENERTKQAALRKFRGELVRLYQMQTEMAANAGSDSERALTDGLLSELERISKAAHEAIGFTYTPLEQLAALQ